MSHDIGPNTKMQVSVVSPFSIAHHEEFVCGWGSAFINIMITFPMNKVMFRQMLHGVHSQDAIRQLKTEGLKFLYRGCLPPMLQKTTSVSLMFGTYKSYRDVLSNEFSFSPWAALSTAAILAGSTEAILTPFERIQTLLQDKQQHSKFKNTLHAIVELRKYGFREYYRGFTPILLRNGVGNIFFFSLKDNVKMFLPKADSVVKNFVNDFISGAFVGALTSTIFYPVNVVKTRMQVSYNTPYLSIYKAFLFTYQERNYSIRKMFIGVHVNYTRAFLSWGIINASHELLRKTFYSKESKS